MTIFWVTPTGSQPVSGPDRPDATEEEIAQADRVMARLMPHVTNAKLVAAMIFKLFLAAVMTVSGAGLVLFGPVLASASAVSIAAWLCLDRVHSWQVSRSYQIIKWGKPAKTPKPAKASKPKAGKVGKLKAGKAAEAGELAKAAEAEPIPLGKPEWFAQLAEAAPVHMASLSRRLPEATLAAATRHLEAAVEARRADHGWLYVPSCPGPGEPCTVYCSAAATVKIGGYVVMVLGEHPAAMPQVAAAAVAHESGHQVKKWLFTAHVARHATGWIWAIAALAGALLDRWPGVVIAAAICWAVSMAVIWAGEIGCDLRVLRTEGHETALAGFGYLADLLAGRPPRPGAVAAPLTKAQKARKIAVFCLDWASGPGHPPDCHAPRRSSCLAPPQRPYRRRPVTMARTSRSADPDPDDPEAVVRAILAMNLTTAIRTASCPVMRSVLAHITRHACRMLAADDSYPGSPYPPAKPEPWAICTVGNSFSASCQIQGAVARAVAGDYLKVLGFDPQQAISDPGYHASAVLPALAAASRSRLRLQLADLVTRAGELTASSTSGLRITGQVITERHAPDITAEATAAKTGTELYHQVLLLQTANVLYFLVDQMYAQPRPSRTRAAVIISPN